MTMYCKSKFNYSRMWTKSLSCFNLTNYLKFDEKCEKCPKHIVLLNLIIFINSKFLLGILVELRLCYHILYFWEAVCMVSTICKICTQGVGVLHILNPSSCHPCQRLKSSSPEQRSGFPTSKL